MSTKQWSGWCLVVVICLSAFAERASAIPAFTRKYKTSCATCHEAFPRLNAVGEAFRLNGYKFADDDLYIKDEPVELGDEAYKQVWPKAIWPSDIPGMPPVSVLLKSYFNIDLGNDDTASTDFNFPHEIEILMAGALGEDMSFFVEFEFENGATAAFGWLQFEDLFSGTIGENNLNIRVGTLGLDFGLFATRDGSRITSEHPLYADWRMTTPSMAAGDSFTANRYRLRSPQPGVEFNGFGSRHYVAFGVVNGNASNADNNSEKDIYAHVALKLGGLGFDGSTGDDQGEGQLSDSESWRDDSIIFSGFGYYGRAPISSTVGGVTTTATDRFWRLGGGVKGKYADIAVSGGYVFGRNEDPFGALSTAAVDSHTWFGQVEYFALPWLIPYTRYEVLTLELPMVLGGGATIDSSRDLRRFVVGAKTLIRANIALTVEGRIYTENETTAELNDDNRIRVALEAAF